jgi:hypothetical protein
MADAGSNSMWANLSSGSADTTTDILGPEYSYADNIQSASSQGVGTDGTFSQLSRNAGAIEYYVKTLITGDPPLGNQFFVNTGGTCTAPDGQLRSRYNYINNMSSGSAALPAAISDLGADFNGLIPGVVDDIEGLNPLYIFSSMTADASPQCACYKCNVSSGSSYQWLTPSMSPDFSTDQCSPADSSLCPPPSTTESFSNQTPAFVGAIPTIIAGLGLALLLFTSK